MYRKLAAAKLHPTIAVAIRESPNSAETVPVPVRVESVPSNAAGETRGPWFSEVLENLSERWCYLTHPDPMWPIHGQYTCPKCFRTRVVNWAAQEVRAKAADRVERQRRKRLNGRAA
jgi:hypothetical protein